MSSAARLYTPRVLGLATGLAAYPLDSDLPLAGAARAMLCGSTVQLRITLNQTGRIAELGLLVHACAIGQAAAALFADAAKGKDRSEIAAAHDAIEAWLQGGGEAVQPGWPGLDAIAAAQDYPARHGAILLPWKAALAALPSAASQS